MGALFVQGTVTIGGLLCNISTTIQIPSDLQTDAQTQVNAVKAYCVANLSPFNLTYTFNKASTTLT